MPVTRYRPRIPPGSAGQAERVPFDSGTDGTLVESADLRFSDAANALAVGGDPADLLSAGFLAEDAAFSALSLQNAASSFFTYLFASPTAGGLSFLENPGTNEISAAVQVSTSADGDGLTIGAGDSGGAVGDARISFVPGVGITFRTASGAAAPTLRWTMDGSGNLNNQTAAFIELLALGADPAAPAGSALRLYCKSVLGVGKLFYIDSAGLVTGPLT